jgi:hypothetical protein
MADPAPAASPPAPSPTPATAPQPAVDAFMTDRAYDDLPLDRQSKYARVRNENNGSEWRLRSDLQPAQPGAQPGYPPAASVTETGTASVTETGTLKIGDGDTAFELTPADVAALFEQKAANDLRSQRVPADGNYEPTLPEGLNLPNGVTFTVDQNDPAFLDLKGWAHRVGLDQEQFSQALGIYAAAQAKEQARLNEWRAAEAAKLGSTAASRVDSVYSWLRAHAGGDEFAKPMAQMMVTAKIVEGFEKIMTKFINGSGPSYTTAHKAPGGGERVSDEQWERWSGEEKWAYARQHDQSRFK